MVELKELITIILILYHDYPVYRAPEISYFLFGFIVTNV